MAVQNSDSVITYSGNGSTLDVYPVTFRFLLAGDVKVSLLGPGGSDPVLLSLGANYTLQIYRDINNVITGGSVKTTVAYSGLHTLFIYRDVPLTQLTELPEFGPFPANTLEQSLDKTVMALQQLDRAQRRCFRTSSFGPELVPPYPQPNTVLGLSGSNGLHLFTGAELLALMQLQGAEVNAPTAYWMGDAERGVKKPDFVGQVGLQMNESSLWRSTGLSPGDWSVLALDEDDMASDSDRRAPTQQSVKAYVATREVAVKSYADGVGVAANAYADAAVGAIQTVPTGVVSPYALTVAPVGWVFASGASIGNASSNGTERAHADCYELFVALWNGWSGLAVYPHNSSSPVSRGASAVADWNADRRIELPDMRGRVAAGRDVMGANVAAGRLTNVGTGNPGVNGGTLGASGGVDRHVLTVGQMPSHSHTSGRPAGTSGSLGVVDSITASSSGQWNTGFTGSNEAHPNVQPTIVLNYIIKL